jgi:hypothetical protein
MSTGSRIAIKLDDCFKSIYCHWGGYPSGVGATLLNHYNTKEKADALIELGDLSSLYESIECPEGHNFEHPIKGFTVAYGRDRNEKNVEAIKDNSIKGLIKTADNSGAEYIYLYSNGKWSYTVITRANDLNWPELTPEDTAE